MSYLARPVVDGTVSVRKKLVKRGIHLMCLLFYSLRDGPVTVGGPSTKLATTVDFCVFIFLFW